jgi:hypothetical protein
VLPVFESKRDWESQMKELLIVIAFAGGWYLLQRYILPKMGIST